MKSFVVAVFLALALTGELAASRQLPQPQQPIQVGIPSVTFNYFAAAQQTPVWCWAASAQMILNYYGIPVTQPQIVTRIFGGPVVTAASDQVINAALNGWGFNLAGQPVTVSSSMAAGLPSPAVLISELQQQRPILLTFQSGPNSGHVVVVTAAAYFPTPQGPQVISLIVRDPYPTPANISTSGRVEIAGPSLGSFAQTVRNHWLVRVQ